VPVAGNYSGLFVVIDAKVDKKEGDPQSRD
jgi:hypothetical protein